MPLVTTFFIPSKVRDPNNLVRSSLFFAVGMALMKVVISFTVPFFVCGACSLVSSTFCGGEAPELPGPGLLFAGPWFAPARGWRGLIGWTRVFH